jgi:hypothetical protein
VQNSPSNGSATFNRSNVFAFDATTGAIDTAFAPSVNSTVTTILPGPDGTSVYLGGSFTIVNGKSSRNVVQLSLANGQATSFTAPKFNARSATWASPPAGSSSAAPSRPPTGWPGAGSPR